MKTLILLILFVSTAQASSAKQPFLIVSDIDDTIKITDVLNAGAALDNAIFGKTTFLGMSDLYQELTRNAQAAAPALPGIDPNSLIVYMSGSPPILYGDVHNLLVTNFKFPDGQFLMREFLWQDIYVFKSSGFESLTDQSFLPFLPLGDDTEKDPEVISDYAAGRPAGKTIGCYIHRVTGRTLPAGLNPFFSAFDVALMEFEAGRLRASQVVRIGDTFLAAKSLNVAFPSFTLCPEDLSYTPGPRVSRHQELMVLEKDVADRINGYCQKRNASLKKAKPVIDLPAQMVPIPCLHLPPPTPSAVEIIKAHSSRVRRKLIQSVERDIP